jgi:hypothetical protein
MSQTARGALFVGKARLLTALCTSARRLLASDGGAADLKGSFGALLANDESILLECMAVALTVQTPSHFVPKGMQYSPFCIWSSMLPTFTALATDNCGIHCIVTASASLADRLEATRALSRLAPRRHLFSEADVKPQILSAITSFGSVALEHVKAHQDEDEGGSLEGRTAQPKVQRIGDRPPCLRDNDPAPGPISTSKQSQPYCTGCHSDTPLPNTTADIRQIASLPGLPVPPPSMGARGLRPHRLAPLPRLHPDLVISQTVVRPQMDKSACGESENWQHFLHCKHPAHVTMGRECKSTIAKIFETWTIDPSL